MLAVTLIKRHRNSLKRGLQHIIFPLRVKPNTKHCTFPEKSLFSPQVFFENTVHTMNRAPTNSAQCLPVYQTHVTLLTLYPRLSSLFNPFNPCTRPHAPDGSRNCLAKTEISNRQPHHFAHNFLIKKIILCQKPEEEVTPKNAENRPRKRGRRN